MTATIAESTIEEASLSWFEDLGYAVVHGPDIAPGDLFAEATATATLSSKTLA